MLKRAIKFAVSLTVLSSAVVSSFTAQADAIADAVADSQRPIEHRVRDEYRNPQQTLRFFDIQADMRVAEISPGGGWYSHILAPLLNEQGKLYAAHFFVDGDTREYFVKSKQKFKQKIDSLESFSKVELTAFHHEKALEFAPAGSLDRVLTFRNVHNWYMRGGDQGIDRAFASFFAALKKGGQLGVVEHKLPEQFSDEMQKASGYMKQSYVIAAAEKAGFRLLAESPVNLNPLDSAEHPRGVWTLPPSLRLGDKDRAKYLAIGESSRMTLKFVKP